ncbi:unnamed protein product [Darwinula stevensoni]|uniref:Methyltransferase-like protein 23 n=1 Tax=Darwinula stevensoni TaxID=69355 RepID=A0A7R8ZZV5_9CRUS|nr:unnamed protein product [Darwinula stevensoni]CAG0883307.1 unnamed protein product [Darwinula stevensoni]
MSVNLKKSKAGEYDASENGEEGIAPQQKPFHEEKSESGESDDGESLQSEEKLDSPNVFRKFHFADESGSLDVTIPEVLHPSYGMYTWPGAVVLAQYIWHNRDDFYGKKVLEIGAGTALPGIVAAKCGACVTLSDNELTPKILKNCARSCEENQVSDRVKVIPLLWGLVTQSLLQIEPVDFIIGSDCFFDPKVFEDILMTVSFILEKSSAAEFLSVYQIRSADWNIRASLRQWQLQCKSVPLKDFGADANSLADSDLPGNHSFEFLRINTIRNR